MAKDRFSFSPEYLGTFPVEARQCSNKSMEGRCPEQGVAYALSVNTAKHGEAVPIYCLKHCGSTIENLKPGESVAFQRVEN